jgi:hypothetical protein
MKKCSRCKQIKPRSEFHIDGRPNRDLQAQCKPCNAERQREWRWKNRERSKQKERRSYQRSGWSAHLQRKYGITGEVYHSLLVSQGNACAICYDKTPGGRATRFHVDHCHSTGSVRGLLCSRCNQMIGYARNRPDLLKAGAEYLHRSVAPQAAAFIRAVMEEL